MRITTLCTSIHPRTELSLTSQTQLQEMSHEGLASPIYLPNELIEINHEHSFTRHLKWKKKKERKKSHNGVTSDCDHNLNVTRMMHMQEQGH